MAKKTNKKLTSVLMAIGATLIVLSVALYAFSQLSLKKSKENALKITEELLALMPEVWDSVPEERQNTAMASLEISKESFIGIIEAPAYGTALPVCAEWDSSQVSKYPCRYTGSIYSDMLIIGGSDNEGQLDFIDEISNYDEVTFTDVSGMRYTYTVTDIRKTKDVTTENLTSKDADLVLFARNTYSLDYTVIRCKLDK